MKRMGHGHLCYVRSSPQLPAPSARQRPQLAGGGVLVATMGAARQRPQLAGGGVLVATMGAASEVCSMAHLHR